jgi:uncharacterized protein YdaU (DUF1376 family)
VIILNALWRESGTIPNEPKRLARICGISTKKWLSCRESIGVLLSDSDGKLYSEYLLAELEKAKKNSEKKRENANKRWNTASQNQCKSNANASDESMQMQCPSPSPSPSPSPDLPDQSPFDSVEFSDQMPDWLKEDQVDA